MSGADDEPVHEPGVVRRSNAPPLGQRVLHWKLRGREHTGVVPEPREQRAPGVAQKCDVTAAGSSNHECQYVPSSSSCARVVSRSGWNVSHITASSCVSVIPIDFSASPGAGPCGIAEGCSVTDPTSMCFREAN